MCVFDKLKYISSPNPIELPLNRIVYFKTILISCHLIGFGEVIMIFSQKCQLSMLIWIPVNITMQS